MVVEVEYIPVSQVESKQGDAENFIFKAALPNWIDLKLAPTIMLWLNTSIAGGVNKVIVDMKKVEYIDSAGIGALIKAVKAARIKNGDVVLMNVSSPVQKTFSLVKLQKFIKIYDSESTAIAYLRSLL